MIGPSCPVPGDCPSGFHPPYCRLAGCAKSPGDPPTDLEARWRAEMASKASAPADRRATPTVRPERSQAALYAAAIACPDADPVSGCTNHCRRIDRDVSIVAVCYPCRDAEP